MAVTATATATVKATVAVPPALDLTALGVVVGVVAGGVRQVQGRVDRCAALCPLHLRLRADPTKNTVCRPLDMNRA